jgi:nucleoside-diphosphate-sugar epimerase
MRILLRHIPAHVQAPEECDSFARNKGLDARILRYHNIFGPYGTYKGGKEKAPAALCRKVAEAKDGTHIEIFGDGTQTRSFLYIDECLEGTLRVMEGPYKILNVGSDEMISINDLAKMVIDISGKKLDIKHIPGPIGVMGRSSGSIRR